VKLLIVAASIVAALVLQGCAALDVRDRPWDPKGGRSLYEQIPNQNGQALTQCCGARPSQCQRHQTDRC
jgi:hypothetical protein